VVPTNLSSPIRRSFSDTLFLVLAILAPALSHSVPVFSQEAPPAEKPVASSSDAPTEPTDPDRRFRDQIIVTAEPSLTMPSTEAVRAELAEVPGGTDLVPAEEYRARRLSTLEDALGLAPGVVAQSRFGAEEARLSIRGSGIQRTFHGRGLALLQDGVPLNLADGGFDFQAVEPLAARHVEVLRGANALRYGASTLGGAINYRSFTGHEADRWTGRLEGGELGYLRGSAATGGVRDDFDYYASLSHFGQDGFREHADQSTQRLFSNFGFRLGDSAETRVYATAVRTDSELPGSLTLAQLEADPTQANPGNVALDQKRDFDLGRLSSRTTWQRGSRDSLELSGYWSWKHLDHPIFQVIDQESDDFGVDLRWLGDRDLGAKNHRFVVGLRPSYGVLDDARFVNVAGERGAPTALARTTSENLELYAEDRIAVSDRVAVVAGVQLAHAGRELEDEFLANGDQSDDPDFSAASPKLGVFFQATPELAVFANASRSFEPPSFGELVFVADGLIDLEPQTATSFEAGVRGGSRLVRYDAVAYYADLENELLSLTDENGNPLGTINAGATIHSGLELGLDLGLEVGNDSRLELDTAYTWGRFRFDGDPVYGDNQLAGLPEHLVRAQLRFLVHAFYLGPKVDWAPEGWPVDHANTLFAGDYAVLGFEAGFRSEHGWSVFVDARNLSDETYAATTGVLANAGGRDLPQFLPGDGRAVYVGFEVRPGAR
jgi:iron complex outermembrane receptor protein